MAQWKSNLRTLIAQKEVAENRRIPITEIMRQTGLARGTVELYLSGTLARIEAGPVLKFSDYLGCNFADLVEPEEEIDEAAPAA